MTEDSRIAEIIKAAKARRGYLKRRKKEEKGRIVRMSNKSRSVRSQSSAYTLHHYYEDKLNEVSALIALLEDRMTVDDYLGITETDKKVDVLTGVLLR